MRERFAEVMTELLGEDERLVLILADLSVGLFEKARLEHPDRCLNLGIREQLLISVAGGMALAGIRPVVHSFAPFLIERPFEQIKLDLNHQDVGAVLVSAGASYDIASGGRSHQAPGDIALLDTLPDWTVHVPGHPDEAEIHLREAVMGDGRVYLRLSNQSNERSYAAAHGFRVLREGGSGTVIAIGPMADATLMATEGLDVTVLYAATIRPFDTAGLRASLLKQKDAAVVIVEPYLAGTSLTHITTGLPDIPHRALGLGVGLVELRNYGTPRQHAIAHGLGTAGIRRSVASFFSL
ncbi:transketolase [Sphaerisporangium album]|uniref:Transketolase n=2 Tax=Sphaerisporangium album TaxID=509200 RepID=A0A367EI63_9ACTN|nr:transketolase [Sphaerisporangium album]RCG17776.1 transketolase [Sphaerisporangium album]